MPRAEGVGFSDLHDSREGDRDFSTSTPQVEEGFGLLDLPGSMRIVVRGARAVVAFSHCHASCKGGGVRFLNLHTTGGEGLDLHVLGEGGT